MRAFLKLLRCMDIKGLFRTPGTDSLVQFFRYAFVGDFAAQILSRAGGQLSASQAADIPGGKGLHWRGQGIYGLCAIGAVGLPS